VGDLLKGGLQPFDFIVLAIIVVSAVMSLGRGLIREASSVISFVIGGLAAYYALVFFEKPLAGILPVTWPSITPSAICVVIGFVLAYSLAAFIGGRVSKLIHANPEIGLVDRLAGAAFGVVRAVLAAILFVLLMEQVLPDEATPSFVSSAKSYPYLHNTAEWVRQNVPGFVARAKTVIEEPAARAKAH
jgi:membrane protein required for colicin V production